MTNNFNVQGFLDALEQNTNQTNYENQNNGNARTLDKLYLSFPGNYGKYQIMPMVSTVTGQPFEFLNNTREVKVTRKSQKQDGTETTYDAWIRSLPASAAAGCALRGQYHRFPRPILRHCHSQRKAEAKSLRLFSSMRFPISLFGPHLRSLQLLPS